MIEVLTSLLSSALPANRVPMVAMRELATARDRWLLTVLTLGTVWLAHAGMLWLALIGLWHLCRWRDQSLHASLLLWVSIGATWALARNIPPDWFTLIIWAWLAGAAWQAFLCIRSAIKDDWSVIKRPSLGHRTKGSLGSPVLTAMFFAIIAPFCPWWGWPILAAGLYITWSWTAFIGVAISMAWMYPRWTPVIGGVLLMLFLLLWWSKRSPQKTVQPVSTRV